MKVRQILEDILMLDKSITISFPSTKAFLSFKSQLHTYKNRFNKTLEDIGESDILDGKAIITEILKGKHNTKIDGPIDARFSLGDSKVVCDFKILKIEDTLISNAAAS